MACDFMIPILKVLGISSYKLIGDTLRTKVNVS